MRVCGFRIPFPVQTRIAVSGGKSHGAFQVKSDIVFVGKADSAMHLDG